MPKVLGIDYGEVRIGLAVSDPLMISANPLKTLVRKNEEADMKKLFDLIREQEVERVVVGLPLNMNGTEGPMAEAARAFAAKIEAKGYEVVLWDERWSSQAAENLLVSADLSRKKRKQVKDNVAAAWFLQAYLDAQR